LAVLGHDPAAIRYWKGRPQEPLEGVWPRTHLGFGFLFSEMQENKFLLFYTSKLVLICDGSLRK
jgi:hypothetical protein